LQLALAKGHKWLAMLESGGVSTMFAHGEPHFPSLSGKMPRGYAHQTYQYVVDLCRHNFTRGCSPLANLIFPACLEKCLVSWQTQLKTITD